VSGKKAPSADRRPDQDGPTPAETALGRACRRGRRRAFVFTGEAGRTIWRGGFNKLVKWSEAVAAIGAAGLHFHDLRHTGNTLASRVPGASLRDVMARMGHDSPRAVLIYQHTNREADHGIADAMDAAVRAARRTPSKRRANRTVKGRETGPPRELMVRLKGHFRSVK
jgi:integrase-like protein